MTEHSTFCVQTTFEGSSNASGEHATLVDGDHVLDVDESVFPTMYLQDLQGLMDKVTDVHALALAVFHSITKILIIVLEDCADGQNLAVVWNKCFPNHLAAQDENLEDFEDGAHK